MGVLLISADLEELIGLSDTIRVILRGRLSEPFDPDTVTAEDLGAAMTGADSSATHPPGGAPHTPASPEGSAT
jgi:simple sugar transport system ATP-binding protein